MGIGVIAIQKGNFTLGRRQLDKDGNVVKETPPRWEHDPAGACVAIVPLKPETMAADGPAEVFGDWQAGQYLAKVLEMLRPTRKTNLPDLEAMIRRAALDGLDLCDYCEDCYMCRDCIVKEWKEDPGGG